MTRRFSNVKGFDKVRGGGGIDLGVPHVQRAWTPSGPPLNVGISQDTS